MQDTSLHIERIPANRRLEAARLMAGPGADRGAGERFISAAERHGLSFDDFWGLSEGEGGPLKAAALLVPSAGGSVMTFISPLRAASLDQTARLLEEAALNAPGGSLLQTLLEPHETEAEAVFRKAGFRHVGDLLYLRRPWSSPPPTRPEWPEGMTVEPWREGMEDELVAALDRSYIDTLDCPELCGLRDTRDVVSSHRATGEFDPNLWWIIRCEGAPEGALLLNPCPAQGHTELVYLGLGPRLRGKRLGVKLLRFGLKALARRAHRTVLCAVDERNAPARRVYENEGFQEFARRTALVRPVPMSADH